MTKENSAAKALEFFSKHSKKILIGLVAVAGVALAAAGGLWWSYLGYNPDILATVGSEQVTKSDLNQAIYGLELKGTPDNPGTTVSDEFKQQLLDEQIERKILDQEAKKLNITVTAAETESKAIELVPDFNDRVSPEKAVIRNNAYYDLLKAKVTDVQISSAAGDYILVRFDKYLYGVSANTDKYNTEKTEATRLANELYTKLSSGQITFDEAQKLLSENIILGQATWDALSYLPAVGGKFDKDAFNNQIGGLADKRIRDEILATAVNTVSQPKIITVDIPKDDDLESVGETKEGFYLISKTTAKTVTDYADYDAWLTAKLKQYMGNTGVISSLLSPTPAYAAIGSCGGGLVTSGVHQYAGFWVRFIHYDASGASRRLPDAQVKIESVDSGTFGTANYGTKSCKDDGVIKSSASPDLFYASRTFTANDDGEVRLGYTSCGGNGYALSCSCVAYKATFTFKGFGYDTVGGGGNWDYLKYYRVDGTSQIHDNNDNTFEFSKIANGDTAGMTVVYQANRPPAVQLTSPACGSSLAMGANSVSLAYSITDADNDTVAPVIQVDKKPIASADSAYTSVLPDRTPAVGELINAANVVPYSLTGLQAGYTYRWRVKAPDSHMLAEGVNATYSEYCTFTVPSSELKLELTPKLQTGQTTYTASLTATVTGTATGNTVYQFDCDANGTWDVTSPPTASTSYTTTACSYATAGTYRPNAQATRGGITAVDSATVVATAPAASCRVSATPSTGLSPLVVRVTVTTTGSLPANSYTYNMDSQSSSSIESTNLTGKGTDLYYTYSNPGTYVIKVTNGATICTAATSTGGVGSDTVTVGNPNSGNGGEVSP